jgi:hypothetical protein
MFSNLMVVFTHHFPECLEVEKHWVQACDKNPKIDI